MWSKVLAIRSRAAAWLTAGIGTFAALALAFVLGAFEAMPKGALPQITAGQSIEAGKWQITPLKAWITDSKIHGLTPKEGQKALVVEVELMNRSIQSDMGYASTFLLPPEMGAKADRPMIYLDRDESLMPNLQPGMAEKMAYVWLMPADAVPKGTIELAIEAWGFKLRNNLTGTPGWWNKTIAGSVLLPISAGQG
ncbi:MAG: hypothetical protein ACRECY_01405 [Phyllobacterium sp.]